MVEETLIQHARRGSLEAFNQLVLAYQDSVYNQAYRLMGEVQAAEDATQEAFLIAFQKMHQMRGGSFRAWLLRIVTNLCYDALRREKRRPTEPLEPLNIEGEAVESPRWLVDPGESPEEAAERSELQAALQRSLNQLPPDFRTALVLVDVQGLDYAEAAAVMGTSMGTLKSRLSRGRLKVQEVWKHTGDDRFLSPRDRRLPVRA